MKVRIESTIWLEGDILERYPVLADFNYEEKNELIETYSVIRDENSERIKQYYSYNKKTPYIEIDSFEDLIKLSDSVKNQLVIGRDFKSSEVVVEIYDGYRE